ncbi:hypothetical protein BDW02DRAFT_208115 [Decorospora gaudefroyi]|uniref:Uncharacterized protein n=1 Tax=Decorospora gaudefroyi TaxID=184978 RepID=A0A6A5KI28_9PLEO|nr:hypothetical protein BDW02DRAFT_208115 [Decorospora gaudefroyi]
MVAHGFHARVNARLGYLIRLPPRPWHTVATASSPERSDVIYHFLPSSEGPPGSRVDVHIEADQITQRIRRVKRINSRPTIYTGPCERRYFDLQHMCCFTSRGVPIRAIASSPLRTKRHHGDRDRREMCRTDRISLPNAASASVSQPKPLGYTASKLA